MSWRLAKSLGALSAEVRERWPGTTIWGVGDAAHRRRASDHNPNQNDIVCAVDVVGRKQAQAVWDHIATTRPERVKYAIFDDQIINSTAQPWKVRGYGGSNPHTNHCHISVGRGPSGKSERPDLYDDPSPWGLTKPKKEKPVPEDTDSSRIKKVLDILTFKGKYEPVLIRGQIKKLRQEVRDGFDRIEQKIDTRG